MTPRRFMAIGLAAAWLAAWPAEATFAQGAAGSAGSEAAGAGAALKNFRDLIATHCSYVVATGSAERVRAIVDEGLAPEPDRAAAVRIIARALGATIDGHASVRAEGLAPGSVLPVELIPLDDSPGGPVVCVHPDRSGFFAADAPFVTAINGVGLESLIERAALEIPDGSAAMVRRRACRLLTMSRLIGPEEAPAAVLTLAPSAESPDDQREIGVRLGPPVRSRGQWPRAGTRRIDVHTAYLRLAEMDDGERFLRGLRATLESFRDARTLIIDVRGNGGGRRDALLMIASFVMAPDAAPLVYNAARPLRLGRSIEELDAQMTDRFMRRADDGAWNVAERRAIAEFRDRFSIATPGLTLDDASFGPWYYGVLSPDAAAAWWSPGRRVLVLMDHECFSATDVFLSAMAEIEHVTLIGRPSSGGSGLARRYALGAGIEVRLSSMVSFRPDGTLLDGNGVAPDVLVWPTARDCIEGGTDTALERALEAAARP